MKKIIQFCGGVYFAIFLIVITTLFVIGGTFVESYTQSHLYAAAFSYHSPIFKALLWGFFINIFVSTLRRWPFRMDHIPFIITHVGLLMIFGGALLKSYYGIQGSMLMSEGSGSEEVMVADSYAIHLEKRVAHKGKIHTIAQNFSINEPLDFKNSFFSELNITLLGRETHVNPFFTTVITQDRWEEWPLFTATVSDIEATARELYLRDLEITLSDARTDAVFWHGSAAELLKQPLQLDNGQISLLIEDSLSSFDVVRTAGNIEERIHISLDAASTLENVSNSVVGPSVHVDLQRSPQLIALRSPEKGTALFCFDPYGRIKKDFFPSDFPFSYVAYDHGHGGYTMRTSMPKLKSCQSRQQLLQQQWEQLSKQLETQDPAHLSAPLKIFHDTCQRLNLPFSEQLVLFLKEWNRCGDWLYDGPKSAVVEAVDGEAIPQADRNGAAWITALWHHMAPQMHSGKELLKLLETHQWPFIQSMRTIEENNTPLLLSTLVAQITSINDQLPPFPQTLLEKSRLFSAYLRSYGIDSTSLLPKTQMTQEFDFLEVPLMRTFQPVAALTQLEKNRPLQWIKITDGVASETVPLVFDRDPRSLKWPILQGKYLIRFQPYFIKIPYRIRLRQAREIHYPNSTKPYSYEADILVTDLRTGHVHAASLSMNHVYETTEGYRFYLSNISSPKGEGIHTVQLVVNYDPSKWLVTYPGAVILVIGAILLFLKNNRAGGRRSNGLSSG